MEESLVYKFNMDKDQNEDMDKTREEGIAADRGTLADTSSEAPHTTQMKNHLWQIKGNKEEGLKTTIVNRASLIDIIHMST